MKPPHAWSMLGLSLVAAAGVVIGLGRPVAAAGAPVPPPVAMFEDADPSDGDISVYWEYTCGMQEKQATSPDYTAEVQLLGCGSSIFQEINVHLCGVADEDTVITVTGTDIGGTPRTLQLQPEPICGSGPCDLFTVTLCESLLDTLPQFTVEVSNRSIHDVATNYRCCQADPPPPPPPPPTPEPQCMSTFGTGQVCTSPWIVTPPSCTPACPTPGQQVRQRIEIESCGDTGVFKAQCIGTGEIVNLLPVPGRPHVYSGTSACGGNCSMWLVTSSTSMIRKVRVIKECCSAQ